MQKSRIAFLMAMAATALISTVGEQKTPEVSPPIDDDAKLGAGATYAIPSSLDDDVRDPGFSDTISCLAKGLEADGALYEDMPSHDEHEVVSALRFPLEKGKADSLIDLDHAYSSMVHQHVDEMDAPSKGEYHKAAQDIFDKMVATRMLRRPDNAKKASRIRNLIAEDVRWEVEKYRNISNMAEKCTVYHGGKFYYLPEKLKAEYDKAIIGSCRDDANYKDMREIFANPDFGGVELYNNMPELFNSNLDFFNRMAGYDLSIYGAKGVVITKQIDSKYCVVIAINLQANGYNHRLVAETLRHEKDHVKHILRNGLPIEHLYKAISNPTYHMPEKEMQFRDEIERCARDLEYREKISPFQASQIWGRMQQENDTSEGLAEAIENIPSHFLQKYCRKVFEFSFGYPTTLRDCKGEEVAKATAAPLVERELEL